MCQSGLWTKGLGQMVLTTSGGMCLPAGSLPVVQDLDSEVAVEFTFLNLFQKKSRLFNLQKKP